MFHFDPRLTGVFIVLFLALGLFNLYMSSKRMQVLQRKGEKVRWYTNVSFLTGLEYTLLAIVLAFSLGITVGFFASSLATIVIPLYYLVLILAAFVMLVIIYQSVISGRKRREAANKQRAAYQERYTAQHTQATPHVETEEQRIRKRDRRRKAAAARRRQSGRA